VLKRYEAEGRQCADLPLVHWACQHFFFKIQTQFDMILQNFPHKGMRYLLGVLIFPLGKRLKQPDDKLSQEIAALVTKPSGTRERLTQGIYKAFEIALAVDDFAFEELGTGSALSRLRERVSRSDG
jgi:acyl-CoA dehydrogenase